MKLAQYTSQERVIASADTGYDWYVEQERKIQDAIAEECRLRAKFNREFDPGYLYVVAFDSGVVKVGRARNAESRLRAHGKTGLVVASWSSPYHLYINKTERKLIAFCDAHGTLYGGREYFRDISFDEARAYAHLVVQGARRREYLGQLVAAVKGDMGATWTEAQSALDAAA